MIIKDVLLKREAKKIPFWFMRQAGRYMSEYMAIRNRFTNSGLGFLDMCYDIDAASEITLQPVRKFDTSAAILFSDILTIPDSMGISVRFETGEGPILGEFGKIEDLDLSDKKGILKTVGRIVKKVRGELDKDKALIGFCGSPFTLACYIFSKKAGGEFEGAMRVLHQNRVLFDEMILVLEEMVCKSLGVQIENGADICQIFDSHAGLLSEGDYEKYVINPNKKIVDFVKKAGVPVICFPRGSGGRYIDFCKEVKPDGISLDNSCDLEFFVKNISEEITLQGNLNNKLVCFGEICEIEKEIKRIVEVCRGRGLIFNLSHGILKETSEEKIGKISEILHNI